VKILNNKLLHTSVFFFFFYFSAHPVLYVEASIANADYLPLVLNFWIQVIFFVISDWQY